MRNSRRRTKGDLKGFREHKESPWSLFRERWGSGDCSGDAMFRQNLLRVYILSQGISSESKGKRANRGRKGYLIGVRTPEAVQAHWEKRERREVRIQEPYKNRKGEELHTLIPFIRRGVSEKGWDRTKDIFLIGKGLRRSVGDRERTNLKLVCTTQRTLVYTILEKNRRSRRPQKRYRHSIIRGDGGRPFTEAVKYKVGGCHRTRETTHNERVMDVLAEWLKGRCGNRYR